MGRQMRKYIWQCSAFSGETSAYMDLFSEVFDHTSIYTYILYNTATPNQPDIELHTSVFVNPSSTHLHSIRERNRHLSKSQRTSDLADRRKKLRMDDVTLFKPHEHTLTPSTPSPSFSCLLPCIIHHLPCLPLSLEPSFVFLSLYHTNPSDSFFIKKLKSSISSLV